MVVVLIYLILREFLAEKLAIEVEYFNPLANVQVNQAASEAAAANAHNMGELVGLALKNSGSEEYLGIDLASHDILARRDLDKKSQSFSLPQRYGF